MNKLKTVKLIFGAGIYLGVMEPVMANPGGFIAVAAFETPWGRILLILLALFFLPLITYVLVCENIAERRARKDLRFMAAYSAAFEWLKIQERAKDCFYRVHAGWTNANLAGLSEWVTDWYWQN